MRWPSRTPTTLAVGFLLLDAILLGFAGVVSHRALLLALALLCAAAAVAVIAAWRRYRRTCIEVDAVRREVQREITSIRELLQSHHSDN